MAIDFLNLEPEREVVKSERLMEQRTDLKGSLGRLQARAFESHPYHWQTIGWMHDLNAITVKEANDYHQVFYAPNNATIIVCGDHDSEQTLAWIKACMVTSNLETSPATPLSPNSDKRQRAETAFKASDPQVFMGAIAHLPPLTLTSRS